MKFYIKIFDELKVIDFLMVYWIL